MVNAAQRNGRESSFSFPPPPPPRCRNRCHGRRRDFAAGDGADLAWVAVVLGNACSLEAATKGDGRRCERLRAAAVGGGGGVGAAATAAAETRTGLARALPHGMERSEGTSLYRLSSNDPTDKASLETFNFRANDAATGKNSLLGARTTASSSSSTIMPALSSAPAIGSVERSVRSRSSRRRAIDISETAGWKVARARAPPFRRTLVK